MGQIRCSPAAELFSLAILAHDNNDYESLRHLGIVPLAHQTTTFRKKGNKKARRGDPTSFSASASILPTGCHSQLFPCLLWQKIDSQCKFSPELCLTSANNPAVKHSQVPIMLLATSTR